MCNWKVIIGNALFSGFSSALTMLSSNGMGITQIATLDIAKAAVILSVLYGGIALGKELREQGENEEHAEKLNEPKKKPTTHQISTDVLFRTILPIC